jgi:hypothetical protein
MHTMSVKASTEGTGELTAGQARQLGAALQAAADQLDQLDGE